MNEYIYKTITSMTRIYKNETGMFHTTVCSCIYIYIKIKIIADHKISTRQNVKCTIFFRRNLPFLPSFQYIGKYNSKEHKTQGQAQPTDN